MTAFFDALGDWLFNLFRRPVYEPSYHIMETELEHILMDNIEGNISNVIYQNPLGMSNPASAEPVIIRIAGMFQGELKSLGERGSKLEAIIKETSAELDDVKRAIKSLEAGMLALDTTTSNVKVVR